MVGKNILEHSRSASHEIIAPGRSDVDLLDRHSVKNYMERVKPELVIHAAGRVGGIAANVAAPVGFLIENMDIGRNVIGAAIEIGVPKFLNLSSSCVYPKDAPNPLKEEFMLKGQLEPTNEGYAIAKIFAMKYIEYLTRERKDLQYKSVIPCNLYGRHDHFDAVKSHLIPAIIRKVHEAVQKNQREVEIWGAGTARREFMDAADLADFIFEAVDRFESLPGSLNVGLGHDQTINDYYRIAADVIGYQGKFTHDLSKPVGMMQKLVSVDRLNAWGWKSKISLTDGIRRAYDYYLSIST